MRPIFYATKTWIVLCTILIAFAGCQKHISTPQEEILSSANNDHGRDQQARNYSSNVVLEWMNVQMRIMQSTPLPFPGINSRFIGYSGVAAYEAVVPGMPGYKSLAGQLNGLSSLPAIQHGETYHWPTAVNAALADMNRGFYTMASPKFQALIDSLENALNAQYQLQTSPETFTRSKNFGKSIASAILAWAATDGAMDPHPIYIPPFGPGLWQPTPPAFAPAAGPYYGSTRSLVAGSGNGSMPAPVPGYSADPSSPYYQRMKEVYDVSQTLTPHQKEMGLYYRDNPGLQGGGGHYMSMLWQIMKIEQPHLDQGALYYAEMSVVLADGVIACWKTKYDPAFDFERPIRYIRTELGHPAWNPLFNTPPHPDFPSGHSTLAGAMEIVFSDLFGKNYQFTNHAYDTLGMPPQFYDGFADMAQQIGSARVYAGIHTRPACEAGRKQGNIVARNILSTIKFHDERNEHEYDEEH